MREWEISRCFPQASRVTHRISLQPVKPSGQIEILFRQTARIMRRERERDLAPANINVGMVSRFLRKLRDGVHKFDGAREILELIGARCGWGKFFSVG